MLHGCDVCQDVCPLNKDQREESEDYPNLDQLSSHIGLEKMSEMDEKTFTDIIGPRFWYINREQSWLWKCNAIRAIANSRQAEYYDCVKQAADDENEKVREMAVWAMEKLGL